MPYAFCYDVPANKDMTGRSKHESVTSNQTGSSPTSWSKPTAGCAISACGRHGRTGNASTTSALNPRFTPCSPRRLHRAAPGSAGRGTQPHRRLDRCQNVRPRPDQNDGSALLA